MSCSLTPEAEQTQPKQAGRQTDLAPLSLPPCCADNCHAFVAHFLNSVRYDGCKDWNPVQLAWRMQLGGSHIGVGGFLKTWGPFATIFGVGVHWGGQLFLLGWAATAGAVLAWFGLYGCLRSKNTSRILSI